MEDYIQEWLVLRAEQASGFTIGTQLSASLQAAVLAAARAQHGTASLSNTFVQAANLVTGNEWQAASSNEAGGNAHTRTGSQRRRLDTAGAYVAGRCYCPVPGCPEGDPVRAQGWQDVSNMRRHLEEHAGGRLEGAIPQRFLDEQSLGQCTVCSRLLSRRFGNTCPHCRPALAGQRSPSEGRPLPAGCPSLEAVFSSKIRVKEHVPKGARRIWAHCILTALAAVVRHNDLRAWTELLALPKMVLRAHVRGGCNHQRRAVAETRQRCQRWLEGQRQELWRGADSRRGAQWQSSSEDLQARRHERTLELLQEQLLHRATCALTQAPPAPVDSRVVDEMRAKHPEARAGERDRIGALREVATAAATKADRATVAKALSSFARGAAAGPSGLRPQHLKEALEPGLRDEVLRHLVEVVNLLARGRAPAEVRTWLCGASLVALPKPFGDLRPIAVGETWHRLVSEVLAATIKAEVTDYLEPIQVGVGTRGGAEAVVHVARQWLHRNRESPQKVLLTLDLENAFNSIDRSAFLAAARRLIPGTVPWVDFCYKHSSHLLLGDHRLSSARGIQQGDPLGPALFAVAIQNAVLEARNAAESNHPGALDFVAFYLDDGTVAGDATAVRCFCECFGRAMSDMGLSLNLGKCEVVPASAACTVPRSQFEGCDWKADGCFKLLGAPVGTEGFCNAHSARRAEKAEVLLDSLSRLRHAQGALHVLRHCGSWCKLVYSARTVPPCLHRPALSEFGTRLRRSLEGIVGDTLPERSWALAQLGILQGGLGIRDPVAHAPAAYVASLLQTSELCAQIDGRFDIDDPDGGLGRAAAETELRSRVLETASWERGTAEVSQKELSAMVDAASLSALLSNERGDAPFQAHIALNRMPGAGVWLTAPPTEDGREIDAPLFQIALKRRLRAPVLDCDGFCPCCGRVMDKWGDHALTCDCGGDRTIRHNAIRNACFEDAAEASLRPEREKAGLLPRRPDTDELPPRAGNRRPADVWLPRGQRGTPEALDFAVTSAMRSSLLRESASSPELVFERYERHKREYQDTARLCEAAGLHFVPMVIEAHSGGWSPLARGVLDWIAQQAAATSNNEPATVALRIAQRMSTALHRENARAILKRCGTQEPSAFDSAWDTPLDSGE